MSEAPGSSEPTPQPASQPQTVVVVGPDGQPLGTAQVAADPDGAPGEEDLSRLIGQPAKVMRIGSMIKQLLEEVKAAPLDEKARARLSEIHRRSIDELESGLSPELVSELDRLALPFNEGETPTEAELRLAQAQLVGWLEGLFHGIQAALVAQQMAARMQLEQMRSGRALPMGPGGMPGMPPGPGRPDDRGDAAGRPGQYL
jgi:Bacterial proteasome activator